METHSPTQLGMVGLGRMGANMVRRLMKAGHHCFRKVGTSVVHAQIPAFIHQPFRWNAKDAEAYGKLISSTVSVEVLRPRKILFLQESTKHIFFVIHADTDHFEAASVELLINRLDLSSSPMHGPQVVKGGWNTVIGYRPQLGKSGQGFVSALLVPKGNVADSGQLVEVVVDHWDRSGVLPKLVSSDDGYSDKRARQDLLQTGIEVVSIGGAKGKKITSAEEWKRPDYRAARANRSGIESLVFTLKNGYEFGQLLRRGNETVRAELTEKILAYNIRQIVPVPERRARDSQEKSLAA